MFLRMFVCGCDFLQVRARDLLLTALVLPPQAAHTPAQLRFAIEMCLNYQGQVPKQELCECLVFGLQF